MAKRTRCRRSRSRAKLCLGLSGLCGDTIIHTSFRSVWVAMKLAMTMCPVCTGLKEPKNRPIFEFILEKALNCMFSCRKYAMLAPALRVYRHCVSRARKTMRNALCLPALRAYGTKNHAKCSVPTGIACYGTKNHAKCSVSTGIACLWHEKPCEMLCVYFSISSFSIRSVSRLSSGRKISISSVEKSSSEASTNHRPPTFTSLYSVSYSSS